MTELFKMESTATITSVEFANLSNREHKDIMKSINSLNEHLAEMGKRESPLSSYKSKQGKDLSCFILSKKHCELIAMKMDTKVMIKVHDLFEELQKPLSFEEMAKQTILLADKKIKQLETKIEEDKPKVAFANTVANSSEVILIREYAKILYDEEGIQIGQNKLFKLLREKGYLNKNNEPFQHFMKYFRVVETTSTSIWGTKINRTTKITGQGQLYFLSKIKEWIDNE